MSDFNSKAMPQSEGGVYLSALGHFTHEKNPVLCAAALAIIEVIEAENLTQRAAELGARFLVRLKELEARHSIIAMYTVSAFSER